MSGQPLTPLPARLSRAHHREPDVNIQRPTEVTSVLPVGVFVRIKRFQAWHPQTDSCLRFPQLAPNVSADLDSNL
jgi:hypothetical protein